MFRSPLPARGRAARGVLLGVVATALGVTTAHAQPQPSRPTYPAHYAITNARVVPVSGETIDRGTIVVRDGVIEAVGADVEVPAGAWVMDGAGMTVYPGLIDALGNLGHPEPRGGNGNGNGGGPSSSDDYSWGPADRPGTHTSLSAADDLASDDRVQRWREAGFTTSVTTRTNGFFPGSAAVINLAEDLPADMVVTPLEVQRINLQSRETPGYPGSLLGSFAYIKQLYADADHYDAAWDAYERDPRGRPRPEYDATLEPLRNDRPVLFPANDRKEIERAIETTNTIGVPLIVYGAQRAYEAPELLREVPVVVDIDWPQPPRDPDPAMEPSLSQLRAWEHAPRTPAALNDAGVRFAFYTGGLSNPADARARIRTAIDAGLPADVALRALTLAPAQIYGIDDRLGSIERGKLANLILTDGELFAEGTKIRKVIIDGQPSDVVETEQGRDGARAGSGNGDAERAGTVAMATDRGAYRSDDVTLIRGATVMTVTNGTIEGGDVLIRDGTIAAVGENLDAPRGATIIDASGKYVTPGIIDAHSHIAADAINEGTVNSSAMVEMHDVIDPDAIAIYRALAGGITTVNLLHGSANPIGGQNVVLKMRWGADAEDLVLETAPSGIKFALGENTKRQRNPSRYPETRMGVQDVIRQKFLDAKAYMAEWEAYEEARASDRSTVPPRRDLEMETLAEILRGERLVHAHSYRSDEILQLLRLADEMGFKISTLQHVLEGYKVADEIAEHGAGASTFSDWWAYKVEAYDAIPHNAALMAERGVLVSINSDDAEEMRHLNQEAAKTMKWGGLSREEALKLVTINPAIQLAIDDRVGSIEVGKDADLVVFDGDPLSVESKVEKTYVDGLLYFDIELDRERQAAIEREQEMLMDKYLDSGERASGTTAPGGEEVSR